VAELLKNREAVAHGLSVMATKMLLDDLPGLLTSVVGERQAAVLLGKLASTAAERGFREFLRRAGAEGGLDPLHVLTVFLEPPSGERVHPFQVVERIETGEGLVRLPLSRREQWSLAKAALMAGVVAGVLSGAGHPAKPLTSRAAAAHMPGGERPEYVVYPERSGSQWLVLVEPLAGVDKAAR